MVFLAVLGSSLTDANASIDEVSAKPAVTAEPPSPQVGWMKWETFNKVYSARLAKPGATDEQKLAVIKQTSTALDQHLTALSPEQLRRVIATIQAEEKRLEALEQLAASTRYNSKDIPLIIASFKELKLDAHGVLVGIGGFGGY